MAAVDRLIDSGWQPRVWSVVYGDYLVSKRVDDNTDSWTINMADVRSGVDVASFVVGSTQFQRVFFARSGLIGQLIYDNDAYNSWGFLPAATGGQVFDNTDVAAVHWVDGSTHRYAVAAVATNGSVCVWNGTSAAGITSTPQCSSPGDASTSSIDIDGAAGTYPIFVYRCSGQQLCRMRGSSSGSSWYQANLGVPGGTSAIRSSVFIVPSIVSPTAGYLDVGVITTNNRLWLGRLTSSQTSSPTWSQAPVVPATPRTDATAMEAGNSYFCLFGCSSSTEIYLSTTNGALQRITRSDTGTWASWLAPVTPEPEDWLGTGAVGVAFYGLGSSTFAFGVGGTYPYRGTLQEMPGPSGTLRDHIRPIHTMTNMLGHTPSGTEPATESVAVASRITALATAIRRDAPPPWKVSISQSYNNGYGFSDDYVVAPTLGSGFSLTDPYLDVSSSGRFHHLSLEVEVTGSATSCSTTSANRRIVYRNGTSAAGISALTTSSSDLFVVADAPSIDHGGLALTEEISGDVINVVWWNIPTGVLYSTVDASGSVSSPVLIVGLPSAPPGVMSDAAEHAYAFSFPTSPGAPTICRIRPAGICGLVSTGSGPPVFQPNLHFGPTTTAGLGCGGGNGQSCFDTQQPFGLVPDVAVPGRIHAVYQANVGGRMRIYYLRSTSSIQGWTTPVPIDASPESKVDYFDPSLTMDRDGTLVATYQSLDSEGDLNPIMRVHVSYSTDGGLSWSPRIQVVNLNRPADLPFHCSRRRFFPGEYREGNALGRRAFIGMPQSGGGNMTLDAAWFSRWSITN